jgi:hypothetical protein
MKIEVCIDCKVLKKIHCKGLCQSCVTRRYRSTEKGREATERYNKTKAVEANRRYRERIRLSKPPKPPKPPKPQKPTKKPKTINQSSYNEVISYIKNGYGIREAIEKAKINNRTFYNQITEKQKQELWFFKRTGVDFDELD